MYQYVLSYASRRPHGPAPTVQPASKMRRKASLQVALRQQETQVSVVSCSTTKTYTATVTKTVPKSSGVCYCFRTFETMTTIWARK
ncbi:hypothetical protein HBI56_111120 [Parastagonospora nodorum]|uniref:Uncharacterized protein n=1 Tax=Phaeosphaeria nodorum (strain SN15 / ATCC MYA-4574 / FGSC 10173) TaxID=321614 RepID=A0A7U2EU28_PHANO|nr:hypothetical protein HBH56_043730 [Parastagonospora nodorum]QRC92822.1 hypothetical protein JI435_403030 [Parastagonospora nodorum SN15]KAH3932899.1 hypothetical protein HBH54_071480 [Parastagonospora nodorum]KAH3946179.1 hypothetical protein HBH53_130670 [Parastagonospora nodorum]KAH3972945.1 hypothetical protein HBH52_143560 [Parastagonospora nodorum]